jgi:hypothetical protein
MTKQLLRQLYHYLPSWIQLPVKTTHQAYTSGGRAVYTLNQVAPAPEKLEQTFVSKFFDNKKEYEKYSEEFDNSVPVRKYSKYENVSDSEEAVRERYDEPYEQHDRIYWTGIKMLEDRAIYALLRKLQPTILVETGVANGWSTMCILAALEKIRRESYIPSIIR